MIRIGIQSEPPEISIGPILRPPTASAAPSAIAEQDHREGPDHVEGPRDHRVGPAAVVAGEQGEDDGEEGRDQRRGEADQQRGPPAVHQPHHLVAAEAAVGAEEELAVGAEPDRPDRRAVGADDVALFAADLDPFQRVRLVGPGVRRPGRPRAAPPATKTTIAAKRASEASATRLRPQPAVGEVPGAAARHYLNWKLVRSPEKIGFQITLSKSMSLETNSDEIGLP